MKSDKRSPFTPQDAELRRVLRRYDPAGVVPPDACTKLESLIAGRVANQPQLGHYADTASVFALPQILNRQLSWPVVMAGTMIFGLLLGLSVSMMIVTPARSYHAAQSYYITTAMAEPWLPFAQ